MTSTNVKAQVKNERYDKSNATSVGEDNKVGRTQMNDSMVSTLCGENEYNENDCHGEGRI